MVGSTEDEHCEKVFAYVQVHSPSFLFNLQMQEPHFSGAFENSSNKI